MLLSKCSVLCVLLCGWSLCRCLKEINGEVVLLSKGYFWVLSVFIRENNKNIVKLYWEECCVLYNLLLFEIFLIILLEWGW